MLEKLTGEVDWTPKLSSLCQKADVISHSGCDGSGTGGCFGHTTARGQWGEVGLVDIPTAAIMLWPVVVQIECSCRQLLLMVSRGQLPSSIFVVLWSLIQCPGTVKYNIFTNPQ